MRCSEPGLGVAVAIVASRGPGIQLTTMCANKPAEDFTSKRWEGIYIIAYRDGSPSEIFFAGCSGD
jgi:hypothetical protein